MHRCAQCFLFHSGTVATSKENDRRLSDQLPPSIANGRLRDSLRTRIFLLLFFNKNYFTASRFISIFATANSTVCVRGWSNSRLTHVYWLHYNTVSKNIFCDDLFAWRLPLQLPAITESSWSYSSQRLCFDVYKILFWGQKNSDSGTWRYGGMVGEGALYSIAPFPHARDVPGIL